MLVLHGNPDIKQLSPKYGYDYETVDRNHAIVTTSCLPICDVNPTPAHFPLQVGGLVYDPFIRNDCVELLRQSYESRPGDIFIATYPKAGTTWLQQIVLQLLYKGDDSKVDPHPKLQTQSPWIEAAFLRGPSKRLAGPRPYLDWNLLDDLRAVHPLGETDDRRRVFKTHAPWQLFPVSPQNLDPKTKIVCVVRNVKSVCVSMYSHSTKIPSHNYTGPWEHWLEMFMKGQVCEGSWFDHTVSA